jgi:phospholipid/cholesterol/gamma-HCH transport system substrate-binding protein
VGTAIRKHIGDFAAIVAIFAVALGVVGYILVNQDARPSLPLIEDEPISIEAEFTDAQAVVPGQGQSVRVAGVQVGKIGSVELENGLAVITMDIEGQFEGLVREDASALLRPRTGLKDMFVELDPGSQKYPAMESGDRIPVENTAPDVDPDEILSALDTDTRAYLKLLIGGAGKGLDNHGYDLREVLRRFEPLHRDLEKVQGALADRREQLATLVHNYGVLTEELGRNDDALAELVTASNDVFEAFASEDRNIARAVSLFPGALRTTEETLFKVDRLGEVLGPTLDDLRPAMRQLDVANREILPLVREAPPILRDEIRPFVRRAQPYVEDLRPAARKLARAAPDLTVAFGELNRFFNALSFNPAGAGEANRANPQTGNSEAPGSGERDEGYLFWLGWVANNTVSLFSTSDAEGTLRRASPAIDCTTARLLGGSEVGQLCLLLTEGLPAPIQQQVQERLSDVAADAEGDEPPDLPSLDELIDGPSGAQSASPQQEGAAPEGGPDGGEPGGATEETGAGTAGEATAEEGG